ncbi:MAG: FAD:protein FMN transferase [Phycisphaerae bacterium]|nr:FAD:protein FMN transferase [Phycisphaerae bacterium]
MDSSKKTVISVLLLAGIIALVAAGVWFQHGAGKLLMTTSRRPIIMNTFQFNLTAVVPVSAGNRLEEIFDDAEAAARIVEKQMNIYNPASELARLNNAPAGQTVYLSAETVDVLTRSSVFWDQTRGAFDITVLPILRLWKRAETTSRLPTPTELRAARNASRWAYFDLLDTGAIKSVDSAGVDVGGVAKGYAIDLAVASMIRSGCVGGIVDIGGDVRCFGNKPSGNPWRVSVTNPFDPDHPKDNPLAVLQVREGAVCTSGNYRRFRTIQGKQYSHIIDPRAATPVDTYPSVTVVAPDATTADAWATALSVLGPDGLKLLSGTEIEALIVIGTPEKHTYVNTPGMNALIESPASKTQTRNK